MEKIPANKAKQARRGIHVLVILLVALVLAGVVWIAVEYFVPR